MPKPNVLLVSYYFPPYRGIGGRRWAKFTKYLSKIGYTINVVCAKNPYNEVSLWNHDVLNNPQIIVHELPHQYPTVLDSEPLTILDKIRYRFALGITSILTDGTPYDRSIFWNNNMLVQVDKLIEKHNIQILIVSCAPFRTAYELIRLKDKYRNLKMIVDFRDPWTWGEILGYKSLNSKRFLTEVIMERAVLENYDYITVPVEVMRNHLHTHYPEAHSKVKLLPHAFDEDETMVKTIYRKGHFRLVFYGTLYVNIEHYIKQLADIIEEKDGLVTLDIYTDYHKHEELWGNALSKGFVTYNSALRGAELFKVLSQYDYVLFIHPEHGKDNLSTKFYEIINCRIPIIYIGEEGYTSRFLLQNELGRHFSMESLQTEGYSFFSKDTVFNYNDAFDVSPYSFRKVTESLEKIIN